jgi:hypothetical protein
LLSNLVDRKWFKIFDETICKKNKFIVGVSKYILEKLLGLAFHFKAKNDFCYIFKKSNTKTIENDKSDLFLE